ncbi:MAG: hypothetical protein GKR89_19010 [Candidatus Latescibacteria bacterium]|nr:hypothetical protein [Candidatus Latescibacterota bacterium]
MFDRYRPIFFLLCILLAACSGSSDGPTSPNPPPVDNIPPVDNTPPTDNTPPAETTPPVDNTPPAGDAPSAATAVELTLVFSGRQGYRDLLFTPSDSPLPDELFVISFRGAEAIWVRNLDTDSPSGSPIQNSLFGAIAAAIDASGVFYFACFTPVMGSRIGVITVRTLESQTIDFQYNGVSGPSGVALDATGRLFVANTNNGTLSRIDFGDGATPDGHLVDQLAQNLNFGSLNEQLPTHLTVDPEGRLFFCEPAASQIRLWSEDNGLQIFAQGLAQPVGIARRANGNLLITNHGDGTIVEFNLDAQIVQRRDTGLGGDSLYGIAVRQDGGVYIVADESSGGMVYSVDM